MLARPASAVYHLRKFARRNRALVASVSAVALALIAGTIVSASLAVWAMGAEDLAQQRLTQTEEARGLAEDRRLQVEHALASATAETARGHRGPRFSGPDAGARRSRIRTGARRCGAAHRSWTRRADEIQSELGDYPEVQANIHEIIGTVYRKLSLYELSRATLAGGL